MQFNPERDVAALEKSFHQDLVPAARAFLNDELTARGFHHEAAVTYGEALKLFDSRLADAFGVSLSREQAVLDSPDAEPDDAEALAYYPLSIASHNLIRLAQVLDIELGDSTAEACAMPQRLLDLEAVLVSFDTLFASYRAVALATA
jgi:hypothetical protein